MSADSPLVMGILNVTPDSFFDGGVYDSEKAVAARCEAILSEGGAWIDVGGCSTRPGSSAVSSDEEWRRVSAALRTLRSHFPDAQVSVDTFRAEIARRAVTEFGVRMVNDISGGADAEMFSTVGALGVAYVLSHHPLAETGMDAAPGPVTGRVRRFFARQVPRLRACGVRDIWLDPGIGFGKNLEENYELVGRLENLSVDGLPLLAGVSRKSMIYRLLETDPGGALAGTLAVETLALLHGARMLRAHDVRAAADCIRVVGKYLSCCQKEGL